MLVDIKYTSARLNTTPSKKLAHKPARKVTFTEQAMAGAKRQAKRQKNAPRTPKKRKLPVRPLIGSSSTWNKEELDRFKVAFRSGVDPKLLIPPTSFDFTSLERYERVREQLTSVKPSDLSDIDVVIEKAPLLHSLFATLEELENVKVTETRKNNLAGKRHEKRTASSRALSSEVIYTGPLQSAEETSRVASISDPNKSSSGGTLFHASQELESQILGNQFCINTLNLLYRGKLTLDWVEGRPKAPTLSWTQSALAAEIKLGLERVGARTDGGMRILLHIDRESIAWDRSYYEVALEAKRFYKTKRNKDGTETVTEISDPNDSIHAGQVFAEMLGAVCHPEFFNHTDLEAYIIYIRHSSFKLYHCQFPQKYLQELYDDGEPSSEGVTLNCTNPFDFAKVDERGEWFDIFVALIQYLVSGESKVGFLNKNHPWNLIHKNIEVQQSAIERAKGENLDPGKDADSLDVEETHESEEDDDDESGKPSPRKSARLTHARPVAQVGTGTRQGNSPSSQRNTKRRKVVR